MEWVEGRGGGGEGRRERRRWALDMEAVEVRDKRAGDDDDDDDDDEDDDVAAAEAAAADATAQRCACDVNHEAHDTMYLHESNQNKHKTRNIFRYGVRTRAIEVMKGREWTEILGI